MAEPSPRTGLLMTAAGVLLITSGYILSVFASAEVAVRRVEDVLIFDAGPVVAAFGLGWLISSLHPMRKWYLYASVAGLLVSSVSFAFSTVVAAEPPFAFILTSLTWSIGPSMILSAIIASIVINRKVAKSGISLQPNPHEDMLDVVVLAALYIPLASLVTSINFYIRYLAPVFIAWLIWHLAAPRFATYLVRRQLTPGNELVVGEPPRREDTTIFNVISRSYYPMAFGLGVTTTVTSILDLIGITPFGGDPLSATANAAFYSIVAIALGSLYVGPVLWIFEDSGIRIHNKTKMTMKQPSIHSLADEMIEIYTFVFSPIGFTFAVADGDLVLAIILLALAFHLLFTISMTATYLYLKFSANPHLNSFLTTLVRKGMLRPPQP